MLSSETTAPTAVYPSPPPYRLNLGSGRSVHQDGWLNCDLSPGPAVDAVFSADTETWPFPDHSVQEIYCCHVLEHLAHPQAFFQEAHRVLQPNGILLIRVPFGGHHAAWWDWTHLRPWYAESFCGVQPGYNERTGNPQHDDSEGYPFGVHIIKLRVGFQLATMLRHWWWRWVFARYASFFDPMIEEIWAHLYALKTPDAIKQYRATHQANIVGSEFVAWEFQYRGVPPHPTENTLIAIGGGPIFGAYLHRIASEERG